MADIITSHGINRVMAMIGGVETVNPFKYLAIGTGTTTASASDTALENEIDRGEATVTLNDNELQFVHTFSFSASQAITEMGIFNASTGGDILTRSTFGAINVSNGDSLQITATLSSVQGNE